MTSNKKIVRYDLYCKDCKSRDKLEVDDPCYECLASPVNDDSIIPINFEKKEKTKKGKIL